TNGSAPGVAEGTATSTNGSAPGVAEGTATSANQGPATGVAAMVESLSRALFGPLLVRAEFWDGSVLGPENSPGTLYVRSPDALRRILWAPGELGLSRAFVAGDLDFDGDLFEMIQALRPHGSTLRTQLPAVPFALPAAVRSARRMGLLTRPPAPPPEEARPHGRRHSKGRDASSVGHHYDVGNDFYRLLLGETMTYSCARFVNPTDSLDTAQEAKHELVCRKLGLHERPGQRLLDVGCGWGSMAIHAARHHGARAVGITISRPQAELARTRVRDAGLEQQVEIRIQDYRDLGQERFDVISSVGMFEHVGKERMAEYFATMRRHLLPEGRLLNHAVSSIGGSKPGRRSFTHRYMFPDGELIDVGEVAVAMEAAGFEVRDVESLREHYGQTVCRWLENIHNHWDEMVAIVGEGRARVWLLYLTAARVGFQDGGMAIHQVLGVSPGPDGASGMPSTRRTWN
ncbi:MAG: class I SAM-dependent methyltransferase, partial [Acidimicrobiales bacterium]